MLDRSKEETGLTKEEILWIANLLGKAVGGNEGQGIADSAAKYNYDAHYLAKIRLDKEEWVHFLSKITDSEDKNKVQKFLDEFFDANGNIKAGYSEEYVQYIFNTEIYGIYQSAYENGYSPIVDGEHGGYIRESNQLTTEIYNRGLEGIQTVKWEDLSEADQNGLLVAGAIFALAGGYVVVEVGGAVCKIAIESAAPLIARFGNAANAAVVAGTNILKDPQKVKLINELEQMGAKFTRESIINIIKTAEGRIVWLEKGNSSVGLQHLMERHATDFAKWGLTSETQVVDLIMQTIQKGGGVPYKDGGMLYDVIINGAVKHLNVVIGNNGFIVTGYPITLK
jgi:hypothetical protein